MYVYRYASMYGNKSSVVICTFNMNTQESEAGGWQFKNSFGFLTRPCL